MIEENLTAITQLGAAGLIGVLWVVERRLAAARERMIDETHRALMQRDREVDILLRALTQNTRAIVSLEASQRRLIELLEARASAAA